MRLANAAFTFSPDRAKWRSQFRYGDLAFNMRSLIGRAGMRRFRSADVVMQIGATFQPPRHVPYTLFCDWNMACSLRFHEKGGHTAATAGLSVPEMRRLDAQQRDVYAGAAAIFTISGRLRQSFIDDYGIPAERVVVAYPGPIFDVAKIPPADRERPPRPPSVLFVGKEFERKGGDVLLAAFRKVRASVPDARLTIIGPTTLRVSEPNVDVLGLLRKDVPAEYERLVRAFTESAVFCFPTLHEPFGLVAIEAMYYGLPCVTSDVWALPEILVDGETGFTTPTGDAGALAARLIEVLRDPALQLRMGVAGRRRAETLFTWEAHGRTLHDRLQLVAGRGNATANAAVA
jgi:glycosyltransferase involved in cell wall biosynthesis